MECINFLLEKGKMDCKNKQVNHILMLSINISLFLVIKINCSEYHLSRKLIDPSHFCYCCRLLLCVLVNILCSLVYDTLLYWKSFISCIFMGW